ncbi:MAG TPA: hypothetical protein H9899_07045 [Candidatus Sphingomonas excrementigallinarum]|nr:hypothetical protein [Candidatus Sphingomonas excrementigallinarum]
MKVKVNEAQPCRAYDVVVDDEGRERHFALVMDFIKRGVVSPRGGSSGPNVVNHRAIAGEYRIIHFLAEEVCDEYEQAMGIIE